VIELSCVIAYFALRCAVSVAKQSLREYLARGQAVFHGIRQHRYLEDPFKQ